VSGGGARHRVGWLTLFGVAMGFLEAAVVVYLRALYYPQGFSFPLVLLPERVMTVELVRELTTVLMILAVAALAGTDRTDRFFVFGYLFGVWDILYYVGLWVFLGWPGSLLEWDVLFLIPVPWLGPVLYPVGVSLALIAGFAVHGSLRARGRPLRPTTAEWAIAWVGALLVILAFVWNWRTVAAGAVPENFPLGMFGAGLVAGVAPFVRGAVRAWSRSGTATR
jgi:hypothetical protein